ncbi:MAG: DUF3303 family protein [Acidobacteriota bacterium]
MKFLITWQVHEDQRHEVLRTFAGMSEADDRADMGGKVKLIGRWHDLATFSGVAIAECDDAAALFDWAMNWNAAMDIDVTPVLDDAEARALGQKRAG